MMDHLPRTPDYGKTPCPSSRATRRNPSTSASQAVVWFQLMKMRLTTFLSALIRRQVVEKWRRYGGSIELISVVRDEGLP
jgi:hypothetical protein